MMLSGGRFLVACALIACAILGVGSVSPPPIALLATEVFATILGLFVFGSFRYQIHKNALHYGMLLNIIATFVRLPTSAWHVEVEAHGWWSWVKTHLLSFH